MTPALDRIAVEEVGADPARLAAAILRQMPDLTGAVPVHEIARALDIEEIRPDRVTSFEGCLLTDPHKSYGAILVNAASSPQRQRYTVAHELGHFLNERHVPTAIDGFRCTRQDFVRPMGALQHRRQEAEANAFAIELLAPERLIRARLRRPADLEHALAIAAERDISREAAIRRYVGLHDECLAAVFSKDGRIRYIEKGDGFPGTRVWTNDPLPPLTPRPRNGADLTSLEEVSAATWLDRSGGITLFEETLYQANGHAVTMLVMEDGDDDGEVGRSERPPWQI